MIDTEPAVLGLTEGPSGDLWILFGVPAGPLPYVQGPRRVLAEGQVQPANARLHTRLLRRIFCRT